MEKKTIIQQSVEVVHTHTHTHSNLIEINRVANNYSKSHGENRPLFNTFKRMY